MDSGPRLIENSAKYYLYNTLQQCHNNRVGLYYYVLNGTVFLVFCLVVGFTLYYCSRYKLSEYEKSQRMLQDQQYIMSKIRYYKDEVKHTNQTQGTSITNLPFVGEQ